MGRDNRGSPLRVMCTGFPSGVPNDTVTVVSHKQPQGGGAKMRPCVLPKAPVLWGGLKAGCALLCALE